LTLIEILIALIIMVLGIVGILALFPPALDSGKKAMEETQAGITGLSVANALASAVRFATYDPGTGNWTATLVHDLSSASTSVQYTFSLPKLSDGLRHHPGSGAPATSIGPDGQPHPDPTADTEFKLCGDPWVVATVKQVQGVSDPSDPLDQFGFSFDVHKVNTLSHLLGQIKPYGQGDAYTNEDLEPLSKLYEFNIYIFRVFQAQAPDGHSTVVTGPKNVSPKRLVAKPITTRVATK
jgi:type II secretory pathway pseudopilin PulG